MEKRFTTGRPASDFTRGQIKKKKKENFTTFSRNNRSITAPFDLDLHLEISRYRLPVADFRNAR